MKFSKKQIERYSRQIILKKIGAVGQKKLLKSSVLIVGAGGLGSPIAIYLTSLGVGNIGIIDIDTIEITTHESAIRIISKEGALNNPADRDHCIQYMTAIGLMKGNLVAEDYEDDVASDPRVDKLRSKMVIKEDERYTREYLEADKRSIANAIVVNFKDGSSTEKVEVEYPIGHRRRREQGIPLLIEKFKSNLSTQFSENRSDEIYALCEDQSSLENASVIDFMNLMIAE